MKQVLGIDIGGTNIKAGIVTSDGKIVKKIKVKTEASKGKKQVINNILKAIDILNNKKISAIGIGCPGTINHKNGTVIESPNLPLNNTPLIKIISKNVKVPIYLENDANCFTLAEANFGAGKNYKNVVGMTIGTGLGGGIVIDGEIYYGKNGAGEIGHTIICYDGPECTCGNKGCLEAYVSVRGILSRSKGLKVKEPLDIYRLAKKGNIKAIQILSDTGRYLGIGITNVMNLLDPDIIIIGGQIADSWDFFYPSMQKEIKKRVLVSPCPVVKKKLESAGIAGTGALALINL